MSNQDNVVINVREQPLSSDINELQSMLSRSLADSLMRTMSSRTDFTSVPRSCVLGGLEVAPSGTNVLVQPGVLAQFSTSLPPTPGSLDSPYRIGRNPDPISVTMPSPVSTTYYVLEAKVVQVVTLSSVRPVLDAGTGTFLPTLVPKHVEYQLGFQLVAGVGGGSVPLPTGGADWVPLAVVRRPGGGGAVAATDIIPIAPQWGDGGGGCTLADDEGSHTISTIVGPTSANITCTRPAKIAGAPMYFSNPVNSINLGAAAYKSPATTFAANTWYYVYLCPWQGLLPSRSYATTQENHGLLVVSDVVPDTFINGRRRPSSAIGLPAPWNLGSADVAKTICIGAVLRNAANNGWVPQVPRGQGEYAISQQTVFNGAPTFSSGQISTQIVPNVPVSALAYEIEVILTTAAAGIVALDVGVGAGTTFNTVPREPIGDKYIGGSGGSMSYGKTFVATASPGTVPYVRGSSLIASGNITGLFVQMLGYRW